MEGGFVMTAFSRTPKGLRRLVLPALALGAAVPAAGCVPMIAGPVVAVAALPAVESRTGVLTPIAEGRYDPLVRYPARNVRYSLTIDEQDGSFVLKTAEPPQDTPDAAPATPDRTGSTAATLPRPASVAVAAAPEPQSPQSDATSPLLPAPAPRAAPAHTTQAPQAVARITTETVPTPPRATPAPAALVSAAPVAAVPVVDVAALPSREADMPPPAAPAPAAKAPVVIAPAPAPVQAQPAPVVPAPAPVPAAAPQPAVHAVPVTPITPDAVPTSPERKAAVVSHCPSGGESWFRYTPEGYVCIAPATTPAAAAVAENARLPDKDCRTGRWVQAKAGDYVCAPMPKDE